jgi:hypothetical protein
VTWLVVAAAVVWAFVSSIRWTRRERGPDRVSERWLDEHHGGRHPDW